MDKVLLSRLIERIKNRTKYEGDCWIFTGLTGNTYRYGRIWFMNKNYIVSRVSACFYHNLNYDDKKLNALHKNECPNKECWNPEHLYVGTQRDNAFDLIDLRGPIEYGGSLVNRAKTHCPHGHEYTKKNTRIWRGSRFCIECNKISVKRWRDARKIRKAV